MPNRPKNLQSTHIVPSQLDSGRTRVQNLDRLIPHPFETTHKVLSHDACVEMSAEPMLIFQARCSHKRTASGGVYEMSALMKKRSIGTKKATTDELARHHKAMSVNELQFFRSMSYVPRRKKGPKAETNSSGDHGAVRRARHALQEACSMFSSKEHGEAS